MILIGKKYDAKESLQLGIVDLVAGEKEVLPTAIALARKLAPKGTDKACLGMLKKQLYAGTFSSCVARVVALVLDTQKDGGLGLVSNRLQAIAKM